MNEIGAVNTPAPFAGLDVTWNRFQENSVVLKSSAGECRIKLGPNYPAATAKTGLTNDANTYSATFLIDGTIRAYAAAGNTLQTVTALVASLNAALAAWATVTLVNDEIVVTSLTTGVSSAVFVSDNTLGSQPDPRLFFNIKGGISATGGPSHFGVVDYDSTRSWFNVVASVVSATVRVGRSIRGNSLYVRFDNAEAVHQSQISAVVDAFLAATGATNQPWLNAASSVALPTGLPDISAATGLTRSTVYQIRLAVDGAAAVTVFVTVGAVETQGASFKLLVQAINDGIAAAVQADGSKLPVVATWQPGYGATQPPRILFTVVPSNTLFTTAATGAVLQGSTSAVVITDGASSGIIAALAAFGATIDSAQPAFAVVNFNRVNATAVAPTTVPVVTNGNYDFTVKMDAVSYNVTVAVTNADTMTVIAASMQAALRTATGALETVAAVGSAFVISSVTATFASVARVTIPTAGANPDLFNAIAAALDVVDPRGHTTVSARMVSGFTGAAGVDGSTNLTFPQTVNTVVYTNWYDVFNTAPVGGRAAATQFIHGLTGFGPLYTSDSALLFIKELRPTSLGQCVDRSVYWDNTNTLWRYLSVDGFDTDASRGLADDVSTGSANNPPQLETLANGV